MTQKFVLDENQFPSKNVNLFGKKDKFLNQKEWEGVPRVEKNMLIFAYVHIS
jgi:hypothetical protein